MNRDQMYVEAAALCLADGVKNDAGYNGAIHKWVVNHVHYRPPDTVYFLVRGIAAAMTEHGKKIPLYDYQKDMIEIASKRSIDQIFVDPKLGKAKTS